jgi:uncharacterized protein
MKGTPMARKRYPGSSQKTFRNLVFGLILSITVLILLLLVFFREKGSLLPLSLKVIQTVDEQLSQSGVDMDHPLALIHQINYEKERPYNYCTRRVVFTNDLPGLRSDLSNSLRDIAGPIRPRIISIRTSLQDDGTLTIFRIGTGRTPFYLLEIFRPLETENKPGFVFPFFPKPRARIAIIIDDVGGTFGGTVQRFLSFPEKITFAIMPSLAYTEETAEAINRIDRFQIMLHQPMQPEHPAKRLPPGEILTNMSETAILALLDSNFASVKYAGGMNNHEGSLATSNPRVMTAVLGYLKKRNLFYIDSYTSRNSLGFKIAKKMRVFYNKRSVFLDNEEDETYVQHQLDLLIKTALKDGSAIGIGHITKPVTIKVLLENVETMKNEGIEFVTAGELLKR